MSNRWALMGSGIGQGINNFLQMALQRKIQNAQDERFNKTLDTIGDPELKKSLLLMHALGGSGGSSGGSGMFNYLMASQMLGGGLNGLLGGNLGSTGMTSAPTGDNNDGVGNIVYTNTKTEPGMIEVRELATGQIGLLPENEFDPAKYQRTKP